jgi:hypothetical protein
MSTGLWVVTVLLVVFVIAAVVVTFQLSPAMRQRRLRGRFGPAYDRAVADEGDRRAAERRLAAVAKRREALDIQPLSESDRKSFANRWSEIQSNFVDQPAAATGQAEKLVAEIAHARGYPVENFDTRTDLFAADYPLEAENYRKAHALWKRNGALGASADTEELRNALVHYRGLFEKLLGPGTTQDTAYADIGSDRGEGRTGRREKSGTRQVILQGPARDRADRRDSR